MQRHVKWTAVQLLTVALLCSGCVPSLHGLAEREDSMMTKEIAGRWRRVTTPNSDAKESGAIWKFTPRESERAYVLHYTDAQGNVGEFKVRETKIGERHYLDFVPVRLQKLEEVKLDDLSGFYRFHLLPIHTFARIEHSESELTLSFMNLGHVDSFLEEHPDAIDHERTDVNGDLLLTASTAELRDFIANVDAEQDLFDVTMVLKRDQE